MNYDLKKPCPHCPFRTDIRPFITPERAEDICQSLLSGRDFPCHKTTGEDDEGETTVESDSKMCAGAMIMLEHMKRPTQMMRISERLGHYDYSKLDMEAPVYKDTDEMIDRHYDEGD